MSALSHTVVYRGADDAAIIGAFARDAAQAGSRGWKAASQAWKVDMGARVLEVRYDLVGEPPATTSTPATPSGTAGPPARTSHPSRTTSWSPALPGMGQTPSQAAGTAPARSVTSGTPPTAGSRFAVRSSVARTLLVAAIVLFGGGIVVAVLADGSSRLRDATAYSGSAAIGLFWSALVVEGWTARTKSGPSIYRHILVIAVTAALALSAFVGTFNGFARL